MADLDIGRKRPFGDAFAEVQYHERGRFYLVRARRLGHRICKDVRVVTIQEVESPVDLAKYDLNLFSSIQGTERLRVNLQSIRYAPFSRRWPVSRTRERCLDPLPVAPQRTLNRPCLPPSTDLVGNW